MFDKQQISKTKTNQKNRYWREICKNVTIMLLIIFSLGMIVEWSKQSIYGSQQYLSQQKTIQILQSDHVNVPSQLNNQLQNKQAGSQINPTQKQSSDPNQLYTYEQFQTKKQKPRPKKPINYNGTISDFFTFKKDNVFNQRQPSKYFDIDVVQKFQGFNQLPFCVVVFKNSYDEVSSIVQSLDKKRMYYNNFKYVYFDENHTENQQSCNHTGFSQYLSNLSVLISSKCQPKSVIVPTNLPLHPFSLYKLNKIYQSTRTWLTYHHKGDTNTPSQANNNLKNMSMLSGISSFHRNLLYSLTQNDFNSTNVHVLDGMQNMDDWMYGMMVGMLKLAGMHAAAFDINLLYGQQIDNKLNKGRQHGQTICPSLNLMYHNNNRQYLDTIEYDPLFHLNHVGYELNRSKTQHRLQRLFNQQTQVYQPKQQITHKMMLAGLQNLEMKNWPYQHSLYQRQRLSMMSKYNMKLPNKHNHNIINNSSQSQSHSYSYQFNSVNGQLLNNPIFMQYPQSTRFCVGVLSYNNSQHNRYKNIMHTLLAQEYNNYHIVFVDDYSNDNTLQLTQEAVKEYYQLLQRYKKQEQQIHRVNITYIQNTMRRYASYNIKNIVDNHCMEAQVLLLLDGDDQLIGRQVFNLINHHYIIHPQAWIVYTNNFSSRMQYGGSKHPTPQFFTTKQRAFYHFTAPVRTYRVKLLRRIQQQDYRMNDGQYLDTFYDDAIQYPVFQMAGIDRIIYIPEICYYYIIDTGYNDNSDKDKISHRLNVRLEILGRHRYHRVHALE